MTDRRDRNRYSALWAAWGDALGFISELAPDARALRQRVGETRVTGTKPWVRRLGGQYGVEAALPAGCYSDDTQLRLATSRAIRGDGRFDVRNFAKVEVVVWQAYALGGGRSTRAAASSLAQRSRDWVSNFFSSPSRYEEAGGNGGAMRIQPHVWAAADLGHWPAFMRDVVRNVIATHGHPRAVGGAAFHAGALATVLESGSIPPPDQWAGLLERLEVLPTLIDEDDELVSYWLPTWERVARRPWREAFSQTLEELSSEIDTVSKLTRVDSRIAYEEMVLATRATQETTRGSATKTSVLSLALAWLSRERPVDGLLEAVNVLGSDTDSIASMAGALLGAASAPGPPGPVMDSEYILQEADRMTRVASGNSAESFGYPDPNQWLLPNASLDYVGLIGDQLALAALGPISTDGTEWLDHSRTQALWQWASLSYGQSVLVRRRPTPVRLPDKLVGRLWHTAQPNATELNGPQPRVSAKSGQPSQIAFGIIDDTPQREPSASMKASTTSAWMEHPTVDEAFEDVARRGFNMTAIGEYLLAFAVRNDGHALAMAFSSMIAKAWRSRHERRSREAGT